MKLVDIASLWGGAKQALGRAMDLSQDALHIHVGVLIFLVVAGAMVRLRRSVLWAWLFLLMVECGNEFIDMNQRFGSPESNWPASRHDIWNTMLLPSAIAAYLWWRDRHRRGDAR